MTGCSPFCERVLYVLQISVTDARVPGEIIRVDSWPKRGLSVVIMLSINTASHVLKLCVVVNGSRGFTGNFTVQHLFAGCHLLRDGR